MEIKIESKEPPPPRPKFKEKLDQLDVGTNNTFRVKLEQWSALRHLSVVGYFVLQTLANSVNFRSGPRSLTLWTVNTLLVFLLALPAAFRKAVAGTSAPSPTWLPRPPRL